MNNMLVATVKTDLTSIVYVNDIAVGEYLYELSAISVANKLNEEFQKEEHGNIHLCTKKS